MCGIACLVGNKEATKHCFDALEKLEYRGYDSAGIACLINDSIIIHKKQGRVDNLKEFAQNTKSNVVISHTRWATHGEPNEVNAHPHMSQNGNFALVHNGIIENFKEIKQELLDKGINIVSQTDSEVALELIANACGSILERLKFATKRLKGSYAFGVLDKKSKSIVGVRKSSPLYVAKTKHGIMLASDIICFKGIAKSYYLIEEGQFIQIKNKRVIIYDNELKVITPKFTKIEELEFDFCKQGFEYHMEKEINEVPYVIEKVVNEYSDRHLLSQIKNLFENVQNIVLIGCGTAYHACCFGAKVLSNTLGINTNAYIASEYKYSNPIITRNTLGIFVSQSGETADTLGCVKLFKEKGAKTLSVTNVIHSALVKMCDISLPVFAGAEIGVASTKAYVAQVLVLHILARYLKDSNFKFEEELELSKKAKEMIYIQDEIVALVKSKSKVFYIGRGFDSITAQEGALKIKEIAYISAEGYPAGELKHGTIALIEKDTPVIVFATSKRLLEKTMSACEEVRSRGAKIILVCPKSYFVAGYDFKIEIPDFESEELQSILSIIPLQMLAYRVSKELGYNPDKPRNLAKSVTVE